MFCSNCGAKAEGNFCSACGAPLRRPEGTPAPRPEPPPPADWSQLADYEALLRIPEVRNLVKGSAARSKGVSGEQFLQLADKAFGPVAGGLTFSAMAPILQAVNEKLGMKTGRSRTEHIARPIGKVLVAALCSLARHNQEVRHATQVTDGCIIEASLPSDLFALEGDLVIAVTAMGPLTEVQASAAVRGQIYDFGKSRRALDRLFQEIVNAPG